MVKIYIPYPDPTIGIIDFLVLIFCEVGLLWFFSPTRTIRQTFPMILAINLIKFGCYSLLAPIFTPAYNYFYFIPLNEIATFIVIGTIFSTIVYEREQIDFPRNQASSLAFRVSSLSTLIWCTFRNLNKPNYSVLEGTTIKGLVPEPMIPLFQSVSSSNEILMVVGLIIGLLMIYIHYNKKYIRDHTLTS
ncbi:MAG: hypothetical protein ACFFB2_09795 [Promethearchaeota archaeon]